MSQKAISLGSMILVLGALVLTGCTQVESYGNSSPPNGSGPAQTIAHLIPLVGFHSGGAARAVVPSTMGFDDMAYFTQCPALTGFAQSDAGVTDGQVLTSQSFLNTSMTFTATTFAEGSHGIPTGTRFTGVLADGSGSLVIEIDGPGTQVWFEEKMFLDDPNGISVLPSEGIQYIYRMEFRGQMDPSDQSGIAQGYVSVFLAHQSGMKVALMAPQNELYWGPWDTATPGITGSGAAKVTSASLLDPAPVYGTVSRPELPLDSSKIEATLAYLAAFEATKPALHPNPTLVFKTSAMVSPNVSLSAADGSTPITTPTSAKADLPSPLWRAKSALDTF